MKNREEIVKEIKEEFIAWIIYCAVNIITVLACIFLMVSIVIMTETLNISGGALTICLICLGWIGSFALFLKIIKNKNKNKNKK